MEKKKILTMNMRMNTMMKKVIIEGEMCMLRKKILKTMSMMTNMMKTMRKKKVEEEVAARFMPKMRNMDVHDVEAIPVVPDLVQVMVVGDLHLCPVKK
jgi:hypothetical protein